MSRALLLAASILAACAEPVVVDERGDARVGSEPAPAPDASFDARVAMDAGEREDAGNIDAGEAMLDAASFDSGVDASCVEHVDTPTPLPACGAADECAAGEVCVTSAAGDRLCGTPISATPPPDKCNTDAECDDGVLCNGPEQCEPSSPLADPVTGCRSATDATPCAADETCVEDLRVCRRAVPCPTD